MKKIGGSEEGGVEKEEEEDVDQPQGMSPVPQG